MSQTASEDHSGGAAALRSRLERLEAECDRLRARLGAHRPAAPRESMEALLRRYEERFRAIMLNAPVEIMLKDTAGCYLQVSRGWERTYGHRSDEIVGKTTHDVLPSPYAELFASRDRQVLETGETTEFEEDAPGPDGTTRRFLVIRFPIADSGGNIAGLCVIATDIDERKRAESALRASEAQLRTIIDNLPVLIGYVDREERFRLVNRTAEEWYSRSGVAIVGRSVEELFDAEYYARLKPRIDTVLSGRIVQFEETNRYDDGSTRYVDVTYIPDLDSEGTVCGFFVLNQDVTDRKIAAEALSESSRQIRTITDNLPVFIAYTDRQERLQFANKTVEEWYARPAREMLGKTVQQIVSPETYLQMKPNIDRVLSGEAIRFEQERAFPDGKTRYIDASNIPDFDGNGVARGWFTLLQDITERKDLEARLLRKERQEGLAKLVALEKEMSARIHTQEHSRRRQEELAHISRIITINELGLSIAHEVNQPLSVISSQAQLCRDALESGEVDSELLAGWVRTIISNADRAAQIIHRIRNYARQQKHDFAPVDVREAIAETIDALEFDITRRFVAVSVDVAESLPQAFGDPIELQQVIINLIQNACEAMAEMPVDGRRLDISARRNDRNMVEIAVADTGPGIDPARLQDIFKPFVTTKEVGLGMGLSISSSIMESFGGRLWAETREAGGAVFYATLPVAEESV